MRAIVIGAGISGLATAYELQQKGVDVHVLETRSIAGGVIRSEVRDGFLIENGPSEMLVKNPEVLEMLNGYGLGSSIQEANTIARKRFIVRGGRPQAVPMSLGQGISSKLFSLRGKLRLLGEVFVPKGRLEDESVASFVSRRVGREFYEYAVGPLVSGVFAGDPEKLSMRHAFPKLWNIEAQHKGLIRGSLAIASERKRSGQPRWKNKLISFKGGMATLPATVAGLLQNPVRYGASVKSIRHDGGWTVDWEDATGPSSITADALVLAVPAHALSRLPLPDAIHRTLVPLDQIEYSPVSTVVLGYRKEQVAHPLDGFGMLVPRKEQRKILGTLFLSTLFPERAPDGQVNLLTFVGGMTAKERASLPKDDLLEIVRKELGRLLGVSGEPTLVHHHYWERAIPHYNVGYQRMLDAMDDAERTWPRLQIVGNFRGGPGVGDCLQSARKAAESLLQRMN